MSTVFASRLQAARACAYLGRRHRPHLVVVRPHEDVGNTLAAYPQDPLVKVLGLGGGGAGGQGGIDEPVHALHLVLLGQHRNVVLERIGHPLALVPHVRDALVVVPVILLGQGLVEAVIEVLVVREDDVPADVVELRPCPSAGSPAGQDTGGETYEALGSDIGGGKAASLLVGVQDHPRRPILTSGVSKRRQLMIACGERGVRTMWWRRLAAPRPVGPAPITRISTFLQERARSAT